MSLRSRGGPGAVSPTAAGSGDSREAQASHARLLLHVDYRWLVSVGYGLERLSQPRAVTAEDHLWASRTKGWAYGYGRVLGDQI